MIDELRPRDRARFWSKVTIIGDARSCWEWIGGRYHGHDDGPGYGVLRWYRNRMTSAPRIAYELAYGTPPPADLYALHRCDNPPCVRPSHLEIGSNAMNLTQCYERSRGRTGSAHNFAKLTEAIVAEARTRYRTEGLSSLALAEIYGVGQPTMSAALHGRTWKHGVSVPPVIPCPQALSKATPSERAAFLAEAGDHR